MKGRTENLICAIPIILIILGLMVVGASYIFDIFELDGFARWGVFVLLLGAELLGFSLLLALMGGLNE